MSRIYELDVLSRQAFSHTRLIRSVERWHVIRTTLRAAEGPSDDNRVALHDEHVGLMGNMISDTSAQSFYGVRRLLGVVAEILGEHEKDPESLFGYGPTFSMLCVALNSLSNVEGSILAAGRYAYQRGALHATSAVDPT